jgi:PAS domain S-box-containing protein
MYSRPIRLAIKGNSSSINGTDYRGNEVYAGFTYFEPLKWVIIAKINTKEVSKTYYFSIIIALILALVFIFLGAFLFIKITNPMLNSVIKSEEKLVVTLNSIGDGVISTDENGLIEGMNPVAAKLCGWNKTDAIGKQLTEVFNIFNSDTRLPATDLVKTVIERGISVDLANHTLLISKENMEYQISNSAAPIKDKDGKIVGVVLIFSDVTSKYDTESALISSERRYRRLFESAKDGILILDAETGMIQDVNPFLIDLLGYSKENFIEKAIWEIGFFKDIVANQDKFLELQQKEYARYEDLPLETADGRKINVEFVSNVYPVNNHKVIQCNIRDITKRKQAEKEIEVLSRFPGENPNPVLRLSKDSILLYANKAAEELVNFCGCSIGHIAPQFMCDMIKEVISQDSCTIFEKQFGSKMWLMTIAPVIEAGYVNIYCSDITERLQAEEAFKESQDFLDKIIQTSGDPIFVKDREHCWVLINEAFCRFIGHNKEQLIGKSDYEFFPKCEADEFWEKDEIVFKNGLENLNEESFTDASGFQHIIQTKKNLYTDFAGNQYLIGIIRDITELKHIEQELRENESKFRNYVNFAPHGIFIADKDGNYIEVNSAASKITGYSKDELLTMNLIDLVSEESMEIAGDQFGNVVNNGFSSGEFAFVKKDGSKGFWSVDAVKLTDDRFLGFVVDITERKKAEQELIVAKYHAEESDKLKTAFLQNMSHEIRTPLNGIIGFSDLLNEENLSGEDIKEFTSMIKQSGKRLLEIVNNVLDISKIQTGQVKIDLRPISINSIFSDLFTFFSLLAKAKNIKLNCYINPDNSQFQVLTDEAKLFQILTNLINNAIKFR